MAAPRVEIPEVVLSASGGPQSGASVQVNGRGAGAATVFTAETGASTSANPIITDTNGRIEGWLEEGSYDLVVSGTGLTTYTQPYEAVRGSNSPGKLATATGDIVYASSANNLTRLPIGSTGNALVVSGGVPAWGSVTATTYRKTTAKAVNTTVAATDLLNGEITVAAGAMGTTGFLRLTALGDWLNNSGGAVAPPRFQVVFGGTTVIDTGVVACTIASGATRARWKIVCDILNLGAANSQVMNFDFLGDLPNGASASSNPPLTTGEGHMRVVAGFFDFTGSAVNTCALDTSSSKTLVLNVINASASASYETRLFGAVAEVI